MSNTRWCIKCKNELAGNSYDFLGLISPAGMYCKNSKCERYGLTTLIYLEEQAKAPENVKSNDPNTEETE